MSSFGFSKVAIIQSLDPGEFETGTELGRSIEGLRDDDVVVPDVEVINVKGRDEFLHAVDKLTTEAEQSDVVPILQIEMHGWENKSGLAFPDDSSLTWQELSDPLARLNKATRFNLLVCMSACFGGHSLSFVKHDGPSPCFALIGPTHSVSPSELLGGFRSFYRELIMTLDVNAAVTKLHAHKLQEGGYINITAEQWFFRVANGYIKTYCTQERLQARARALTDQIKNEGRTLNDAQLAAIAQFGTTLATNFVDRQFPTFFMVDAIPENSTRFGQSLTKAKQEVADFMAAQK
ncbi:hypothetical protein R69749_04522 [Paraburkholderia domus]|nr:hypothetical protein R70006_05592 [Paraburkholderia domus]CAE6842489.1 hypothetical protein R69749_04522 [Paraburkholderia domus]